MRSLESFRTEIMVLLVSVSTILLAILGSIPGSAESPRPMEPHPVATIQSWTVSPANITLGQSATFTVIQTPSSCCQPYDYFTHDTPPGCANTTMQALGTDATQESWVCTPSSVGTFMVNVQIRGSLGSYTPAVWTNLTVISSSTPTLSAVSVSPSPDTLQVSTSAGFTATISCVGGECPSGPSYTWSFTNNLVTLNATTGNPVTVTAGSTTGTVTLFVNVTLNGVTKEASTTITIQAKSSSGSLGLQDSGGYILIGVVTVIVVVVAVVAVLVVARSRRKKTSHLRLQSVPFAYPPSVVSPQPGAPPEPRFIAPGLPSPPPPAGRSCQRCGEVNGPDAAFCHRCGQGLAKR